MAIKKELMLDALFMSLKGSGFIAQFLRSDSLLFSVIKNDLESIEWVLENTPIDGAVFQDLVKARRKLLPNLNILDYSYECKLLINTLKYDCYEKFNKRLEDELVNSDEVNNIIKKISTSRKYDSIVDANDLEKIFMSLSSYDDLLDKVLEYNKDLILELHNNTVDKINEIIIGSGNVISSTPDTFRELVIVQKDWFAENEFKHKRIDLLFNFDKPEEIKDFDYIYEAIIQDVSNYNVISDSLKNNPKIINLLILKLENAMNNIMDDINNSNNISIKDILDIKNNLSQYISQFKVNNVDDDIKGKCISLGVPIEKKYLNDHESLQILSVNYALYEKFQENKTNVKLQQSGSSLCRLIMGEIDYIKGNNALSKLIEIEDKEKMCIELNSKRTIDRKEAEFFDFVLKMIKDECVKNKELENIIKSNDTFHLKKFKSKDFTFGEIKTLLELTDNVISKAMMRDDVKDISIKKLSIKKF